MPSYRGRGLHGQVVDAVGRNIVHGIYAEGSTLSVESLQQEHGVSLTVVRETLKVLAAKGLVDSRQRRGTLVEPRSRWNLLDPDILLWEMTTGNVPRMLDQLAEVRSIFEPAAAELAATRRDEGDIAAIDAALSAMEHAGDPADAIEADLDFHRAVLASTKNELLSRVELLTRALLAERDRLVHQSAPATEVLDLHRDLRNAIARSDVTAARAATVTLLGRAVEDAAVTMQTAPDHGAEEPST